MSGQAHPSQEHGAKPTPAWIESIVCREGAGGVSFSVKIHPRAKRNAIQGEIGGALKLSLTAPALEGRANEACIAFLAALLHVSRSTVSIVSGERSRNKTVRVAEISAAQLRAAIAKNL